MKSHMSKESKERNSRLNPYLINLSGKRPVKPKSALVNQKSAASLIKKGYLSSSKKIRSEINNFKERNARRYLPTSNEDGKKDDYEKIITNIYMKKSPSVTPSNPTVVNTGVKELKRVQKANARARPSTSLSAVTLARSGSTSAHLYRSNHSQLNANLQLNSPPDTNYFAKDALCSNSASTMNAKLDHNSARLAALSSKYELSNVLIHRHPGNEHTMKPAQSQLNYEEEQAMLSNGLKNLALRQQERIYSAGD